MRPLPASLKDKDNFSRKEFEASMHDEYGLSVPQISYDLSNLIKQGIVTRIGWGRYSLHKKKMYDYENSETAMAVAWILGSNYEGLDFQIYELRQLNDFMNHQVAHNTIFVWVEHNMMNYVFDTLWSLYPGKVLLKPRADQYYRYKLDDEIIICRLPSETPKGSEKPWKSRLEKIIVDVYTDKLLSEIVPEGEKKAILEGAIHDYTFDKNTMIRYAKRKGSEEKVRHIIKEYEKEKLL